MLLEEADALGDPSPDLLVRLLVEPMVDKLDDERGRAFLTNQAERSLRPRPRRAERRPLAIRLIGSLGLADVPAPTFELMMDMGLDLAYVTLAKRAQLEAIEGRGAGVGREEFVHQLTRAVSRVCAIDRGRP